MKNVLMICFFFPPVGGAGTQRSSKFVKYLSSFDWCPTVIAGIDPTWPQDRSLLKDIPDHIKVHRFPLPASVWRRTREWMFSHRFGPIGWGHLGNQVGRFLDFPDTQREWSDTAAKLAVHLARQQKFDAIYTTAPPYSACTAIREVQKELALPWVADFRDPWATEDMDVGLQPTWVRKRHASAERETITHADVIVSAHPDLKDYFVNTYKLPDNKCQVVYNGFDKDDFVKPTPCRQGPRRLFTITHTGTLYRNYNADALARALRDHWVGPPEGLDEVVFRFVGGAAKTKFEQRPGLTITITPRVEHHLALFEQSSADLLVAVFDRGIYKGHIPGKLFEYLASGRPILGVIPSDGAMAQIIRKCRAGWVADCDKPREIVQTIQNVIGQMTRSDFRFEPDWNEINKFSRLALTKNLAAALDQASKFAKGTSLLA